MKKGFTMIELIFVIVILGILAAVAIPRLTATRDDAEVSKAASNLNTIISDFGAYYTSQSNFANNLETMTNVQLKDPTGDASVVGGSATAKLTAANNECLKLTLTAYDSATRKPANLRVEKDGAGKAICDKIHKNPSVEKILTGKFKYKEWDSAANKFKDVEVESNEGEIAISGLGVVY